MKFPTFFIALIILSLSFTQSVNAQSNSTGDYSTIVIVEDVMEIVPNVATDGLDAIQVTRQNGTVVYTNNNPNPSGVTIDVSGVNSGTYYVAVLTEVGVVDDHTISIP